MMISRLNYPKVTENQRIIVGRIGRPHGIRGWNKLHSYTRPTENIKDYRPWLIEQGSGWHDIQVLDIQNKGNFTIAQFESCADRDQAQRLTGKAIAIRRNQMPELSSGEYYWNDLIGIAVKDTHHQLLGYLDHWIETEANDIMVVRGEKELLIPYRRKEVVLSVDLIESVMIVDWDPDF